MGHNSVKQSNGISFGYVHLLLVYKLPIILLNSIKRFKRNWPDKKWVLTDGPRTDSPIYHPLTKKTTNFRRCKCYFIFRLLVKLSTDTVVRHM